MYLKKKKNTSEPWEDHHSPASPQLGKKLGGEAVLLTDPEGDAFWVRQLGPIQPEQETSLHFLLERQVKFTELINCDTF